MTELTVFEQWMSRESASFEKRTPASARMFKKAQTRLPGGDTRTVTFFNPYPAFVQRGEGCKLIDIDGNSYLDFLNNYTVLIHGHAHPAIVQAVKTQLEKGTCFAGPTESQHTLAELICERVKSVEQIRFCNSGTEATLNAIRAARIISGKSMVVKMEGGYHGSHDLAEVSITPNLTSAGPIEKPNSVPQSAGIPNSVLSEVIVVPFNNRKATEDLIRRYKDEIACVIVEPVLGVAGVIPPEDGYLQLLRDLTTELNKILIFDEVVTFRLALGGAQSIYQVHPDITAFGKTIGGGLPIGAFGGSKEIMKVFSPLEKKYASQSGTFNANPLSMVAGIACLKQLTSEVIEHINSLGILLRKGMDLALSRVGIRGMATGVGSLTMTHINKALVRDYRSASQGNFQALLLIHMRLLEKGVYVPPRGGEYSISSAMDEGHINTLLAAFEESLIEVKPFIEQTSPELII